MNVLTNFKKGVKLVSRELIEKTFNNSDNYKVVLTNANNNNAIVFFSSHAIYGNDGDDEYFKTRILVNNRFEWENVSNNKLIQRKYKLLIFVRDLKKETYRFGINSELNSYDKIIDKIAELTKGYNLTTCGNSAGGYMAQLCGIKLNAERIFTFSGYFKLPYGEYPILKPYISGNIPMFYFVPYYSEGDIIQYNESKECKGVYTYLFDSKEHGVTVKGECYPLLLTFSNEKLIDIYNKNKDKIIDKNSFYRSITPAKLKLLNLLGYIFSIKNEECDRGKRKILCIFGIKLKITLKNLVKKEN